MHQIIAEETETPQRLSSTATLTVTVTDANDNRPVFEHDTYSFTVSETAPSDHLIGTITARDLDSGRFGTNGIRYSLSGTGSELFNVNDRTGAITVAKCQTRQNPNNVIHREKREAALDTKMNAKKVNLTIVGETGVIDIDDALDSTTDNNYFSFTDIDELTFQPFLSNEHDYLISDSNEETTTSQEIEPFDTTTTTATTTKVFKFYDREEIPRAISTEIVNEGPGLAPCLDYETQSVYFLSYKVCEY